MAEASMSDRSYKDQRGIMDRLRELSGVYHLGFEPDSFLGLIIPIGIVIVVGGILGYIISTL
jgi:hypothetical protein